MTEGYPKEWLPLMLEEAARFIDYRGRTPKKTASGIPLITAKNIRVGFISREPREFIADDDYDDWMTRGFPLLGDTLITTEAPLGNVAMIDIKEKFALAQRAICLKYYLKDVEAYSYYFLRCPQFQTELMANATGTTVKGIKAATLKKMLLVLPPIAEQREIARRLDELLAQVDTLKTRLDAIPSILKRFRQSTLAAAVSGKLTERWPNAGDHFYDELDDEIKADVKLRNLSDLERDEIELSTSLHGDVKWKRWKLYPLEKLVDSAVGIPYGIVQTRQHTEGGVPTVRCGDVKPLMIDESDLKLVQKEISDSYKRTLLSGGEVLLAIRGTVGNAAVAPSSLADCNISREVALIPVRKNINPHFIALLLQSPGGYKCLAEKVRGVAQQGINLADIKRFVVPLPSLEEQAEIVRRVEELFAFTDQVEQRVNDAQSRVNHLTQSILAKAFRGELTEEWRTNHPDLISGENSAAALLKRIKTEREKQTPKKKTRKKK
jgi:type I restriction enzyme S subunit